MTKVKDFILSIGGYSAFAAKLNEVGAVPPVNENAAYVMAHRGEIPKARWSYVMAAFDVSLEYLTEIHAAAAAQKREVANG